MSEEAFGLLVEQMRPFGVSVVAYPRRDDLKHLEARGVIGFFMGPGDGPSMDRVHVKSTTKSTVRQYRHVVTPRVCLEEYAMKLHCSELHTASDMSDEQVLADQEELPEFERGLFEVDARHPDEVLPYTDEPFMEHVKAIATFDTVRAVPPDPTRQTVGKRGVNVQWQAGEYPPISERHNQPGTALHTVEHPDVIQRVATGETTAHGTVEVDVYGTVERCTGKSQSCSTYAHNLNRLVEVVVNN